ncbi:MAG TPA: SemiSWEET transporter [Ignavibacteria bacterium]|nr:SemiSWEET transporter [Ignavibacteria bacterium]HMR38899.1 SemiSWEET transporter [Ignavibacteria bacterium]
MDTTLTVGLIAASLTTFAFLPQSLRAIKTKHTKDISLPMLLMLEFGVVVWIVYGSMISDIPLLAANIISFIFVTITLVLKLKYG